MKNKLILSALGFTLIEMMVALALFTIVITIASGSILALIGANARSQGEQNIMSTMTFALDSMTREIRTGTSYFCDLTLTTNSFLYQETDYTPDSFQDCTAPGTANGLSFVEGGSSITGASLSTRIAYYFDASKHTIMRRVGNGIEYSIIADDIYVKTARFYVTGTKHLNNDGDTEQPTVTIVVEASETNSATDKSFNLQTTVTQRELDI